MSRFFHSFGPILPARHYAVPPLSRLPLDEMQRLIQMGLCFSIYGPAQSGKTTCLTALVNHLNQESSGFAAFYANLEVAQEAGSDLEMGIAAVLAELSMGAARDLDWKDAAEVGSAVSHGPLTALKFGLSQLARRSDRPLVLCLDGIDELSSQLMSAVFRQIRTGIDFGPSQFPHAIIFGGTRDARTLIPTHDQGRGDSIGGSYNVCAKGYALKKFTPDDIQQLFMQHSRQTGQKFTREAIEMVFELTQGHPRLVNALAYEVCFEMETTRDRSVPLTEEVFAEGKEHLLGQRQTYFDFLAWKLRDEKVRRVLDPVLAGDIQLRPAAVDDLDHVVELGLVQVEEQPKIANRIFQEIIPREIMRLDRLGFSRDTVTYHTVNLGHLDSVRMIQDFQNFYHEHGAHWLSETRYSEAGPLLLFQAFIQSIINDGGRMEREYGWGRRGVDLFLFWPTEIGVQSIVIECRNLRSNRMQTIQEAGLQTVGAMELCGSDDGHLILFDRNQTTPIEERCFHTTETHEGQTINVWGM